MWTSYMLTEEIIFRPNTVEINGWQTLKVKRSQIRGRAQFGNTLSELERQELFV